MGFTSDACFYLLLKSLPIKNNKKREAALQKEAGVDERTRNMFFFFTWPYMVLVSPVDG